MKFCSRLFWLLAGCVLLLTAAESSWKDKPVSDWTEQDARQILSDSPWAKTVTAGLTRVQTEDERREGGNMGQPHGVGFDGVGEKEAKPRIPNILDRSTPSAPGFVKLRVRWETALPVRVAELKAREKRVEKFTITPLAPADAARFTQAWNALQGRFIDNPKGVVVEADTLVRELMLNRGYPMGDFEMRAADISVDHPTVVENYRAAQAIAVRDERGEADTEELRKAVVHYRTLFDELLGERPAKRVESPVGQIPVHS